MSATYNYFPYLAEGREYDFRDKSRSIRETMSRFYARTSRMFRYGDLPKTIDRESLEVYLQSGGYSLWKETKGGLYVYSGGLGGEPDEYYHPTIATISNPAQNISGNFKIGKDCILMKNDSMLNGIDDIIRKYATLMAENELSLWIGLINTRIISLMTAKDDNQSEALNEYIQDVIDGNLHSIFDESFVLDGIKIQPYANSSFSNNLVQMTEIEQFLMGNLYRELGLKGAYNTKRENISEAESKVGDDTLKPLIDDMLLCRKEGLEKVNEMFGTNITVELDSAWEESEVREEEQEDEKKEGGLKGLLNKLTGGATDEEKKEETDPE